MTESEEISDYINKLSFDLKAEMLISLLLEKGADIPEIHAVFEGQHKRIWSRDIDRATFDHRVNGEDIVNIHLNRDGIYDLLPEAVFHEMLTENAESGEEMAEESRMLRDEEKEARLFFWPFENEIFMRGVHLSSTENVLYRRIYTDLFTGLIPGFWKIDENLPLNLVGKLKKILPEAYHICGDMDLTAECLAYVVDEKVAISSSGKQSVKDEKRKNGVSGGSILGTDLVLGDHASGHINTLTFTIGPVTNNQNLVYIKTGAMDCFLDCFYSYFIPFELDTETKYVFGDAEGIFTLNEEGIESSCLAFNSVIQ